MLCCQNMRCCTFVLKHLFWAFTLMWSQVKTFNIAMFIRNVLSVIL